MTLPLQASYLPAIINFILNDENSGSSNNSEFDSTVVPLPNVGAYHGVYTILNNESGSFTVDARLEGIAEFEKSVYETTTNSKRAVFDRQFYRWDNFLRDDGITY